MSSKDEHAKAADPVAAARAELEEICQKHGILMVSGTQDPVAAVAAIKHVLPYLEGRPTRKDALRKPTI